MKLGVSPRGVMHLRESRAVSTLVSLKKVVDERITSHQHTVVGVVCSYIALWPRLSASWCQSVFVSLRREVRQAHHAPGSPMCLALEEMTAAGRIWFV